MHRGRAGWGLLAGVALAGAGPALACSIDGVPSLAVNGRLVVLNPALPVKGQLATWTPFAARGTYPAGHPIVLQEVRSRVIVTLPPGAFKRPWRWLFGDRTTARGPRVRHNKDAQACALDPI